VVGHTLTITQCGAVFKTGFFKNVIVNGIILAEDGQKKMSSDTKNYPTIRMSLSIALLPFAFYDRLLRSKPGEVKFSELGVKISQATLLPLWNSLSLL
jgi:isoleucyl-tRNA synthetase